MLRSYLFKLLHSSFLYAGMIGVFGLCLLGANDSLDGIKGFGGYDVYTDMNLMLEMKGYRKAFIVFGAIPFAANFADEWNSKTITNCVSRKNASCYAVSNIMACFMSALVTVFIPLVIFAAFSSCFKIFLDTDHTDPHIAYSEFAEIGLPFLSTVFYFLTFALSCAMWAVMGMTLSAFFPSKYIALGAPFIFSHVIERLTVRLPYQFDLMGLSMSYFDFPVPWSIGYPVLIFGGLSAVCGIFFVIKVKKKVQNELS